MANSAGDWASLGGQRVISGTITIPMYGLWAGDVLMSSSTTIVAPGANTTLVLGDLSLACNVYQAISYAGSRSARLVGGFGGWRKPLSSRAYTNAAGINLSMIVKDAATEIGEKVNIVTDSVLGTSFIRESAPAVRLLRELCNPLWFIDPTSGVVQIGASRNASLVTSDFTLVSYAGGRNRYTIASEVLGDWLPGRTFTTAVLGVTATVSSVMHTIDNDGVHRLEVLGVGL